MTGDPANARSPRDLIDLHARTLFVHDASDRLIAINDTQRSPAARFFLGRTSQGVISRVRHDLPAALADRLTQLAAREPVPDDLEQPPGCLDEVRALLAAHGPITDEYAGPEYSFPARISLAELATRAPDVVAITASNAHTLTRWLPEWLPDVKAGGPIMAVLVDGDAVAICACARVPGQATHAGVETHPEHRGHGHAALATAAWAPAIRALGILPLYGTSWTNRASQRVAAKLGLVRYGASLSIA